MGLVGTIIWFIFTALSVIYLLVFFALSAYKKFFSTNTAKIPQQSIPTPKPVTSGEITENLRLDGGTTGSLLECGSLVAGYSIHIGGRKYQEDSVKLAPINDGGFLAAVCDGMGGLKMGAEVSSLASERLLAYAQNISSSADVAGSLRQAAIDTDLDIVDYCAPEGVKAGTTAVAALVFDNTAYWLSVGDSRIYLLRNHELFPVTRDHNYALELQQLLDAGEITQQQVMSVERPDALISFLGMGGLALVDVGKITLGSGDALLLCSDGLTKALSDSEIAQMLDSFTSNVLACAEALATSALQRGGERQDNTTVIVIRNMG